MEDRSARDLGEVEATLRGDTAAFGNLVARYQKLVAHVAWRYGIRSAEIEDVVSEAFLKAYQNLHQFRPEHPFSTWLYRLAVNHTIDFARRRRRERGDVELPGQFPDPHPAPGQRMLREERAGLLRRALRRQKPHYREVLFAVYIEGLKVEEVARTLGLPVGTVKTRLMRGRESLRRVLTRDYPEYFGD